MTKLSMKGGDGLDESVGAAASGRLAGKVAVVTGGASGIGRACALRFAAEGAAILVADLDADRGAAVAAEVEAAGEAACFVETNTASEQDCEAMADAGVECFGRIDVLVAAAGVSHGVPRRGGHAKRVRAATDWEAGALLTKSLRSWERVLAVNLTGVMLSNRAVARRMIEGGVAGSIVNLGSAASFLPFRGIGDYCVSKAGVWMLTKVLADELAAHRIRVNALAPGLVETPMAATILANEVASAQIRAITPMNRFAQPEEIASAALFLASDESSYVTGEILSIDGGMFTG